MRTAPIVCPKESPLLASISDNFVAGNPPLVGPDAPTPAREKGLQPYGALDCFEWRSEGGAGGRAESPQCARRRNPLPPAGSDAPTPARIGTGRPKGRSIASGGEPKVSKGRAESPLVRPQAQTPAPVGIDAPTPARVDGAAAPTGDSTFFRRERKYQRKRAARRLREKALYCPF